ncbi:hypothetical protein QJS04_geneDACA008456 [Acorus gramineus]|uniref:AB hydrolase-1 domain-containing protein n=1 Tax=Acorus gramineus TaxID=55184 RepID=A0AAV9AHG9_ACOGR|nr:hypothetical protein QJS04_geneDACA008456 [Acorus gramineus]
MAGVNRKISAASARSHTRKQRKSSSFRLSFGLISKILAVLFIGFLAWAYQAIQPPPPSICGSPNGPPVTSSRIKLRDGRHLAYKENGVPKDKAKYKIIFVHGVDSCRHDVLPVSSELYEKLGIYLVSFDRPGYGESDADPNRSVKSIALDIQELADKLDLRSKFYVIGFSMGGQVIWSCLKYIPHRLAGATLIAPVVNYWWPNFPANLSKEAYSKQLVQDQWTLRVAHYCPWLMYWWNSQNWFPSSSVLAHDPRNFPPQDRELFSKFVDRESYKAQITQQGKFYNLYQDMIVNFGSWEFDPMDLENPFPNNKGSVHLWQGDLDRLSPVSLQRYIVEKLPWIRYHELPNAGHMFSIADGMADAIVEALLLGEKQ